MDKYYKRGVGFHGNGVRMEVQASRHVHMVDGTHTDARAHGVTFGGFRAKTNGRAPIQRGRPFPLLCTCPRDPVRRSRKVFVILDQE